jgi:4'-phosphopantetheinyl transferase
VVDIWRAQPHRLGDEATGLQQLLEEQEQAAWHERPEWARSRALLRAVLSRYTGEDARLLRFTESANGKPALAAGDYASAAVPDQSTSEMSRPRLRFNLSHSEGLVLIAVTADSEVGIDVEVLDGDGDDENDGKGRRGRLDEVAIARRALGEEQASRLARMEGRERRIEFLRAWTRYEAQIKCLGIGLGGALARDGREDAALSELWVRELDVAADAFAAVAVQGRESCELRLWEWTGELVGSPATFAGFGSEG